MYLCNGFGFEWKKKRTLFNISYSDHKGSTNQDLDYNALLEEDGDYGNLYTNGINYDLTTEKTPIPGLESNQ